MIYLDDLGKIAYEAYFEDAGGLTFDGRKMPTWDELGDDVRRHWTAAGWEVYYALGEDPDE